MPTYGYQCTQCQHEFSVFQNMKDDPIAACPQCEGKVKRLLYPVGVVFKGSGWYINDSRKPEKSESDAPKTEGAKAETSGTEAKSETKSTDSTPAAKTEPATAAK